MKPPRTPDDHGPKAIKEHLEKVNKTLSNISFGSSVPLSSPAPGGSVALIDADSNMEGHKVYAVSPAAPNTEFAVPHSLGRVPMGFIYMGGSNQGLVYKGATPWTATQIFLKETQGSNGFILFIL